MSRAGSSVRGGVLVAACIECESNVERTQPRCAAARRRARSGRFRARRCASAGWRCAIFGDDRFVCPSARACPMRAPNESQSAQRFTSRDRRAFACRRELFSSDRAASRRSSIARRSAALHRTYRAALARRPPFDAMPCARRPRCGSLACRMRRDATQCLHSSNRVEFVRNLIEPIESRDSHVARNPGAPHLIEIHAFLDDRAIYSILRAGFASARKHARCVNAVCIRCVIQPAHERSR
ncbi:hypothetical protein X946_3033 [Burkholderia sp. ABCPW 111]|nr:hypothetical protein X946_3033 [Burkholderia sp. ABCPW 111]